MMYRRFARLFEKETGKTPAMVMCEIARGSISYSSPEVQALAMSMRESEEAEQRRKEKYFLRREAEYRPFRKEIYDFLKENRNVPYTATDIQFHLPDFVERHITNQKVAHHLANMIWRDEYDELARFTCHGRTFFVVGAVPSWADKPQEVEW